MVAAVETSGRLAAFASRAEPAWHGLGEVFAQDEAVSTSQMLTKAHLAGWDVRLRELQTDARSAKTTFEVLRTNPFDKGLDRLGLVGSRYHVVQNEDAFTFADGILDGGATWETAGSILGGTVVFGSLSIDRNIVVGAGEADDVTKMYLLVHTSHDGSTGVQASITPVRVVCQNTLNAALRGVKQSFKIRHTQGVDGKMVTAREALGLTFKYADAFENEANALYQTACTKDDFDAIIAAAYSQPGPDASKAAHTRFENGRDLLMSIWEGKADGPDTMSTISGTKWGAFNALTERLDWYRTVREDSGPEGFLTNAAGFDTVTNKERNRLLSVVKAYQPA
jgi:phage/plasmid-like protein (TIGR03299 family)